MKNKYITAIICAATLVSCGQTQKQSTEKENYYETMEVSLSDRTLTTGYSAAISGVQTVEIRPQISGMITEILIEEGESVRKGQVLFIIDQTPYKAAYEIAVANVKSAEASLSTAKLIVIFCPCLPLRVAQRECNQHLRCSGIGEYAVIVYLEILMSLPLSSFA